MRDAALDPGACTCLDAERRAGRRIGVAVSGGSDSTALLCLLADRYGGDALCVATVDHGLRPESGDEARAVARLCATLGASHDTLHWQGRQATGNLQDAARRARYGLLGDWAGTRGIMVVTLAHTRDDTAETVLMGLGRGAGLDGLSGMRPRFRRGAVTFQRPLLAARRDALRDLLRARGLPWCEDPSNADPRFDRVKARAALQHLAPLGIDAASLARSAGLLSDTRAAIEATLSDWAETHCRTDRGDLLIGARALSALPRDFARRILAAGLRWASGADYPPRAEPVLALLSASAPATLHGCLISPQEETLRIAREPRAAAAAPPVAPGALWDGRWRLTGADDTGTGTVRALTEAGLAQCPDWRATGLPRASLAASPALWHAETVIAAPLAGLANGWRAEWAIGRGEFPASILSR